MKRIVLIFIFVLLLCMPVCAEAYDLDGANEAESTLSDGARDYFNENGIDIESTDWINSITTESVFSHIWGFITDGAKQPLRSGALALGIILITAGFTSLSPENGAFPAAAYVSVLAVVGVLAVPVYSSVSAAVSAIKGCTTFMLSFVPVFAAAVAVAGGAVTSVTMSSLLLAAAEAVGAVASFIILPLMGAYLAVGICSSVSPLTRDASVAESIKKIAMWILSFITTVFLGVLSIQTTVNSAADSVTLRTSKFIIGTAVPVAGGAISEAVSTVTASMQVLKSSVGIYGILALSFILLPVIAELCMWRLTMLVLSFASGIFADGKISALTKAIDAMLALLIGITLLIGVMFIISLTVVVSAGKAA